LFGAKIQIQILNIPTQSKRGAEAAMAAFAPE